MSYASVVQIVGSGSLRQRIAACAAQEGYDGNPLEWVDSHIWQIASSKQEWIDAWAYAVDTETPNQNPDTGARNDVISDAFILSVVQPMLNA